ncbi:MAG: hypothetical protein RL560_698, partial [Actinomycetota bacterium]
SHNGHTWPAFNINVGNPHAVVFVDSLNEVGSLSIAPNVAPKSSYPEGAHVELAHAQLHWQRRSIHQENYQAPG